MKSDAEPRFDFGDDLRAQPDKGARRRGELDRRKIGVIEQRQLVRVLVQPSALFGGEPRRRVFRRAVGPDADHGQG